MMGHPLFSRHAVKHDAKMRTNASESRDVGEYALEQQMYDGGPWNRSVTGDKASVQNHRDSRLKTNPDAKLRIVKV